MAEQGGAPAIKGLLETSLYARDLKRTAAFYRDLFGLTALVDSPRLVAFEVARRSVLLIFQAGSTEDDVKPKRGPQDRPGDFELSADIRRLVDQRPTYGYRRIAALLKRERRSDGLAPINTKRVYRLMKKHGLLLERHTGRRRLREHDGQVATIRSNVRWCSDGLEFTGWSGEVVARRLRSRLPRPRGDQPGVATTAGIVGRDESET